MRNKWLNILMLLSFLLTSCTHQSGPHQESQDSIKTAKQAVVESIKNPEFDSEIAFSPAPIPTSTPGSTKPDLMINPLTGLPADSPENLTVPPALISVTNWPVSARPQAGLSYSPMVFELYIGEGMTRFLAMFYGDFPSDQIKTGDSQLLQTDQSEIGPIRSGRLPYESIRALYNGFIIMASAYKGVAANLGQHSSVLGSDSTDINSAMVSVTALEEIAKSYQKELGDFSLSGNVFDAEIPQNGSPANQFWMIYNSIDQVVWEYDSVSGAYLRYQDQADGKTFVRASDRLNGLPLTFENVIVLFANHRACNDVAFDVDLMYINRAPALLFRDGNVYPIYWTTRNEEFEKTTGKLRPIRFVDAAGNPISLKPGQTWVHLVPNGTAYWESPSVQEVSTSTEQWISKNPDGMLYRLLNNKQPESGNWVMRYYASLITYDKNVCEKLKK